MDRCPVKVQRLEFRDGDSVPLTQCAAWRILQVTLAILGTVSAFQSLLFAHLTVPDSAVMSVSFVLIAASHSHRAARCAFNSLCFQVWKLEAAHPGGIVQSLSPNLPSPALFCLLQRRTLKHGTASRCAGPELSSPRKPFAQGLPAGGRGTLSASSPQAWDGSRGPLGLESVRILKGPCLASTGLSPGTGLHLTRDSLALKSSPVQSLLGRSHREWTSEPGHLGSPSSFPRHQASVDLVDLR